MKDADYWRYKLRPYSAAAGLLLGAGIGAWVAVSYAATWSTNTLGLVVSSITAFGLLTGYLVVEFIFGAAPGDSSLHEKSGQGDANSYGQVQNLDGDRWD